MQVTPGTGSLGGYLQFAASNGTGGAGVWSPSDGSGLWQWGRTPPFPDDNTVQTLPNWTGDTSGELNSGHMMYYPLLASKLYIFNSGTASTPAIVSATVNPFMKSAMQAGTIPWGIVVYPNKNDPDDNIESWGVNAYDGSFKNEDMVVYDIPAKIREWTGLALLAEDTCCMGFSEGGFITLRYRAKFGTDFAGVFIVMDGPRLDADLGGAANSYSSWNAAEKTKLWADSSANMQHESPLSSIGLDGIFNRLGVGTGALLMIKSSPGGSSPATNASSMNNASTKMTALGVPFSEVNIDNAAFTPSHNLSQQFTAWAAETTLDANGDKMDIGWIKRAAVRAGYSW